MINILPSRRHFIPTIITMAAILFTILPFPAANAVEMADMPIVKLRTLEKLTARTSTFEASVGNTVKFGNIFIKVQACRKTDPVEKPESASFLQIWEIPPETKEAKWIFSGWMFASSPGLSAMDHPVYDVWVLDCLEAKGPEDNAQKAEDAARGEGEIKDDAVPAQPTTAPPPATDTPR